VRVLHRIGADARDAQELGQLVEPGLLHGGRVYRARCCALRRGDVRRPDLPMAANLHARRRRACKVSTRAKSQTSPERARSLADLAEDLCVCERAELLERLVLDLADALARHVEGAADLVERPRMLPVEAVAKDQDLPLAHRELVEQLLERLAAKGRLGGLV